MSVDQFSAVGLSLRLDRPVINKTGLSGLFNFPSEFLKSQRSGEALVTYVEQQLGLKLEATEGPHEFLVIDNIEKPTEN